MAKQRRPSLLSRAWAALVRPIPYLRRDFSNFPIWRKDAGDWVVECDHDAIQACKVTDTGQTLCSCTRQNWKRIGEKFVSFGRESVKPMKPRTLEACLEAFKNQLQFVQLVVRAGTASYRIRNIVTDEIIPVEALL